MIVCEVGCDGEDGKEGGWWEEGDRARVYGWRRHVHRTRFDPKALAVAGRQQAHGIHERIEFFLSDSTRDCILGY